MANPTLSRPGRLLAGSLIALLALTLAAAGAWYFFVRDSGAFRYVIGYDPPAAVSLSAALEAVAAAPPADATAPPEDLRGAWSIVPGETTFAGYRVVETLASFGTNTAVGRTRAIEGQLEFDGHTITHTDIVAGLQGLASDQSERDENLRTQAIETDTYPTARFVLTTPIEAGSLPGEGEAVQQSVRGELTLHGVTREVVATVEGALQGGLLVVVGSTEVAFADYGIERPTSFSVLSTEDHGTLEFQLVFVRH